MNMHRIIVAATVAVVSFGALADVYVDEYGSWQYEKLLDEKSEPYAAVITGYYPGETPHSTVKTPASINIEKTEGAPPRYIPVCQINGGRPNCDDFVIRGHGDLVVSGLAYADWTDGPTNLVLQGVKTIGHFYETGAFRGNTRLETVEADSSLDLIEQYAFDACPNLRSFTGATGLSEILSRAFQNCTALKLPPLNSGLKTIGDNAFNGCASLCEVNIPDSVTSVGSASFVNCPSVTNITFHSGYSPIGSGLFSPEQMAGLQTLTICGNGETVVKDAAFNKYPMHRVVMTGVKEIHNFYSTGPFMNCANLETVVVDNWLTTLPTHAFAGCTRLRRITGLTGLTVIKDNAFLNCTSLETITLYENLKTIESGAFNGCTSLLEIDIPDSVTSIGGGAFANCPSVMSISFGRGMERIPDGLFSTAMPDLQTLVIRGNGNTVISPSAFKDLPVRSVTMTGVATLEGNGHGWGPFQNCTNLVTVTADDYLTTVGHFAFDGCTRLRRVGGMTALTEISPASFRNCAALTEMTLPEGLLTIGDSAFNGCASLRKVYIPDSVTTIGGWAWRYCSSITNISFGVGYSPIYEERFSPEMPGLDTVTVRGSGETVVSSKAFKGFPMRRLVLTGVTTLDGNGHGWGACQNCTNLETVAADETLELINVYAFDGCKSLKRVSGATGLTTIGGVAFRNCAALEEMTLPEGLLTIGDSAFSGCASLREVYIPNSVTTIGGWAWRYCSSITNISFGAGYSPIRAELFSLEMPDLQTLTIRGSGTTVCYWDAFKGFPMRRLVLTGVTTLDGNGHGWGACQNCTNLETVAADETLELINVYAFDGCKSLESITGITGLTTIGNLAFRNCKALKSVVLPSTLTAMNDGFNSCALEQMVFLGTPPNCSTTFDASCQGYYVGNTAAWQAVISGGKWHGMTMSPAGYVPEEKGGGKGILITEAWLDELDAEFGAGTSTTFRQKFGEDLSTAIYELTGKVTIEREPKPVWHDYVTGTNPVDLDSLFRAFITMEGTTPNVTYDPVRADRVYRLWGTNDLGGEWVELAPGEEPDYHFFKATVEMP